MYRLSIPRAILAIVYLALSTFGAFSALRGDVNLLQLAMLVAIVITLLALVRILGRWAQIVGLVFGSLYAVIGVVALGLGVWGTLVGHEDALAGVILGPLFLALGVPTILSLRSDMRSRSVQDDTVTPAAKM